MKESKVECLLSLFNENDVFFDSSLEVCALLSATENSGMPFGQLVAPLLINKGGRCGCWFTSCWF